MKKSHLLGAICAGLIAHISFSAHAVAVSGQGTWETTLQARDFDGDSNTIEGYYDTVLDITWLQNANLAASNTFGITSIPKNSHYPTYGIRPDGTMTWETTSDWIAAMNSAVYLGLNGWRLPETVDVGNDGETYISIYEGVDAGYSISTHSEMSHMSYIALSNAPYWGADGNATGCPSLWSPPSCMTNTGPFSNHLVTYYWSGTEYAPDTTASAWAFSFGAGHQSYAGKTTSRSAWAVHDGDVGTAVVPIPSALWLFGSGLLGLIGISKHMYSKGKQQ